MSTNASTSSSLNPKVWLITGCSSGLGLSLALHALKNNQHVIATSRNPSKTPELVSQIKALGGHWLTLDITLPEADLSSIVSQATSIYGKIDVLVNNAGYALLGAFESITEKEARSQMETNFFGPMKLTRLVLPGMRKRGSGMIVQISSAAGTEAKASRALYSASKFALEGMSEALYNEVKPLGVRVLLVELGFFNTPFAAACVSAEKGLPEGYEGTAVEVMMDAVLKGGQANAVNDVGKGAARIFENVMEGGMESALRLPLGRDSIARCRFVVERWEETLKAAEKIDVSI